MFNLTCLHQSLSLLLSLALSLSLHLQTRVGSRSDSNGIQDRMFRQFKIVCTQSVNTVECPTLPYKRRCAQKVWVFIGSSCNKIDWLTQTLCFYILRNKPKQKICVQTQCSLFLSHSLSLSLYFYNLLSKFANSFHAEDRATCLIRGKQAYQEL